MRRIWSELSGTARGILVAIAMLAVGLVILPTTLGAAPGPREWLEDTYDRASGDDPREETVVYRSTDTLDRTVAAIVTGTAPQERTEGSVAGEPAVFLRYGSDWMVAAIAEDAGTTRIELDEFDAGYDRHQAYVGGWSGYVGRGGGLFRGGGTGSGK